MTKKPPLVAVVWVDAAGDEEIHGTLGHVLDRARLWIRETAGYLIHQDGEDVPPLMRRTILAHDYDAPVKPEENPQFGNITTIPSGWVIKIRGMKTRRSAPAPKAQADAPPSEDDGLAKDR